MHSMSRVIVCTVLLILPSCWGYEAVGKFVDGGEVTAQLLKLATYSSDPNPAVTRVLFTPTDMDGRRYVKQLMSDVGLHIREDAMGNIFGQWPGSEKASGKVLTGSHCDAIPMAGAYDGTLGVVGGIAAIAALKKAGFSPLRSIEVMMFTSEEPTRFGLSCLGSRAMAGALSSEALEDKKDENGMTFLEAANAVGYGGKSNQEILDKTRVKQGEVDYFVELHIEQGPLLEKDEINIGVVTAIAAPAALEVNFTGNGGHAGALLMRYRKDAGLAAAELALAVEQHTLATGAEDTVGTTGIMEVAPNAVNSVPREARCGIDIRDIDGDRRDEVVKKVKDSVEDISKRRGVGYKIRTINQDPPATCHREILTAIEESASVLGLSHRRMVSRAYHDSLFMARVAPTAMIFIPCRDGVSHRPDEFASEADIANGVKVLALTLSRLAGGTFGGDKTEL